MQWGFVSHWSWSSLPSQTSLEVAVHRCFLFTEEKNRKTLPYRSWIPLSPCSAPAVFSWCSSAFCLPVRYWPYSVLLRTLWPMLTLIWWSTWSELFHPWSPLGWILLSMLRATQPSVCFLLPLALLQTFCLILCLSLSLVLECRELQLPPYYLSLYPRHLFYSSLQKKQN